jgi:dihydropteroate synthase
VDHQITHFQNPPASARLYVRPCGFVDGPFADPAAAVRLAGGSLWFSQVELILRVGSERFDSVMLPVRDRAIWQATLAPELAEMFATHWARITGLRAPLDVAGKLLGFTKPLVMGILNITPDSFSDGGKFSDAAVAVEAAHEMMKMGASIIDCGAESTRPGAKPVWEGDEIARLQPVLERLKGSSGWLSADTRKSNVMRMALENGAQIINDISGLLHEPDSMQVVATAKCPVIIMHMQGDPQTMQRQPEYGDTLLDVYDWLEARINACEVAGVSRTQIIIDPGIGFGKSLRHNLDLLNGLSLFHALGCPILLGVSRKTFIGALSKEETADARLPGSLSAALHGLSQGVQILRVHDVAETLQAMKIWLGLRDAAVTPRSI